MYLFLLSLSWLFFSTRADYLTGRVLKLDLTNAERSNLTNV